MYKNKYLKYKNKYLYLKNSMKGGADRAAVVEEYVFPMKDQYNAYQWYKLNCPMDDKHMIEIRNYGEDEKLRCEHCREYRNIINIKEKIMNNQASDYLYWKCYECNFIICPVCLYKIKKYIDSEGTAIELQAGEGSSYKDIQIHFKKLTDDYRKRFIKTPSIPPSSKSPPQSYSITSHGDVEYSKSSPQSYSITSHGDVEYS